MAAKRFLGLDGLRGVCALTVLLYHCSNFFFAGPTFAHGYLAVDVFFMLSGFVIALNYEQRLRDGETAAFFRSRAGRLLPTYWMGAALNIAVFLAIAMAGILFKGDSWWMIWLFIPLATLLMIPDFFTPDGTLYPGMEGVTWSLFLEWLAYAAYASGVYRWRTSTLVIASAAGWLLMAFAGYHTVEGWSAGGTRPTFFTIGLLRCLPAFIAGVAMYRIHRHELFKRLPVVSTEVLLATWLAIAAIPSNGPTPTFDTVAVILGCPLIMALLIRSDRSAPLFCKRLGEISYPLYVAHPGIVLLAHYTTIFGNFERPHPLNGLLVVALCLAVAWLIMQAAGRLRGGKKMVALPPEPKLHALGYR